MSKLNPEQTAAVVSAARNTVVVAGPGSGKTHVLVERACRAFDSFTKPVRIAVVTYTLAAAAELRARLKDRIILSPYDELFIGTIHALALSLLRGPWAKFLPCPEPLTVMTQERNERAVQEAIARVRYKGTQKAIKEEFKGNWSWLEDSNRDGETPAQLVLRAYYQTARKNSMISYDDLIKVATAICQGPGFSDQLFDELLVDEFQDASEHTDLFIRMLPVGTRFVIGDPRQSIYGFLGGSPQRVLNLEKSAWTFLYLTQSYRCRAGITDAANRILSHGDGLPMPEILPCPATDDRGSGSVIVPEPFANAEAEMEWVTKFIKKLRAESPKDSIAVLARTNFIVNQFAEYLTKAGVPVVQSDKAQMPEEWEVILALAAVLDTPHNDALVHDFLALTVGPTVADKIRDEALLEDVPMASKCENLPAADNAVKAAYELDDFAARTPGSDPRIRGLIMRAVTRLPDDAPVSALRLALADPGLKDAQEQEGAVSCITCHSAKGREFDHVFIVGCNEGILPGRGSASEERRLMFVAMTRARITCSITCAQVRLASEFDSHSKPMKPSPFILEATGKRV